MKVADLLATRQPQWHELEMLCSRLENRWRRRDISLDTGARFAALYRAACADLALADAYQLPPPAIRYLHQLVGRAHNQLYRSRIFRLRQWARQLLVEVPGRLYADRYLRLAMLIFWGVFLASAALAYQLPGFAEDVMGKQMMTRLEDDFLHSPSEGDPSTGTSMAGFYIFHNGTIGLRCFAFGLVYGIGGLFETVFNAGVLGASFGYMALMPQWTNFSHFVTAHGPFELTAIVLSAAAGMRMGFSLIDTHGLSRGDSLYQAACESMTIVGTALVLFALAAAIEGLLSPSRAPYEIKAAVAVISTLMLIFYIFVLGWLRKRS